MNFWKSKLSYLTLYPRHNKPMGYLYNINHNYFDEIDTEYKAYILGLIYADGCITQPKGNRQLKFTISLQEGDGYILEELSKNAAGGNFTIKYPPSVQLKGWQKQTNVNIVSNKLCNKLIEYGCKINKSRLGMDFPKIKEELIPHFIRGFLDGDGSIIIKKCTYNYKRKTTYKLKNPATPKYKLKIAFCSTDLIFLETLSKLLPTKKVYFAKRKRTQIVYILWIENTEDVKECIDYLYKDANYFFKRKYEKVKEFNKTIKSQAESKLSEGLETT